MASVGGKEKRHTGRFTIMHDAVHASRRLIDEILSVTYRSILESLVSEYQLGKFSLRGKAMLSGEISARR